MHTLWQYIQNDFMRKQVYFQTAAQEIASKNLHLLKTTSIITSFLLITLMAITPLVIPGWVPSMQHILFLPVSLGLMLLIHVLQKKQWDNPSHINWLCLAVEAVLFLFIMAIDICQGPEIPASFMPMLCISMPTLLILPTLLHYGMIFSFEVVYILAALTLKDPFTAQYDIFNSIVGIAFSFSLAHIMMNLRVQDFETRHKYQQLSIQDTLSGLLNKRACREMASRYLDTTAPHSTCALLILDVDNFKHINDELGHYTGDTILQRIGTTLAGTFRSTDIVGRFGGDEFLILLKDTADYTTLEQKCRMLLQKLQISDKNETLPVITCSIGGVLVNRQNADFQTLFRQADEALYQAKAAGKNTWILHYYQTEK